VHKQYRIPTKGVPVPAANVAHGSVLTALYPLGYTIAVLICMAWKINMLHRKVFLSVGTTRTQYELLVSEEKLR
jgi:hypothetical protein